jgi:hypothetical protein
MRVSGHAEEARPMYASVRAVFGFDYERGTRLVLKEVPQMRFARKVHFTIARGKEREFSTIFESKVLPLLKKQNGFEDELILLEGNEAMGISVWKDRLSAENYQKADYTKVLETLKPLIDGSPRIETCDVPVRSHVAM